jgi:ATP-dependent Zn protease
LYVYVIIFFIFYIFIAAVFLFLYDISNLIIYQEKNLPLAYAHIFTDTPNTITKNIDKYQVVFLPYPNIPSVNDNSTKLNFSLMENNTDVYNVFVSLIIKDRNSGNVVEQIPYKFYEFGDITLPYIFQNVSDYIITFQAKINGDPKYEVNPLKANFDISVVNPSEMSFIVWTLSLIPILAVISGILIFIFFRKKKWRNESTDVTT